MYYPKSNKKRIMMKAKLTGTTFTGHPCRTTFGNSCRMMFYTMFICMKAGIPYEDFIHYHAGDDVLVRALGKFVHLFIKTMKMYALTEAPEEETKYGLG
jgi:hypothetical protein